MNIEEVKKILDKRYTKFSELSITNYQIAQQICQLFEPKAGEEVEKILGSGMTEINEDDGYYFITPQYKEILAQQINNYYRRQETEAKQQAPTPETAAKADEELLLTDKDLPWLYNFTVTQDLSALLKDATDLRDLEYKLVEYVESLRRGEMLK